jgi:hypothetical protein
MEINKKGRVLVPNPTPTVMSPIFFYDHNVVTESNFELCKRNAVNLLWQLNNGKNYSEDIRSHSLYLMNAINSGLFTNKAELIRNMSLLIAKLRSPQTKLAA